MKGEGLTFYSSSEVIIAYNEKKIDLHSIINVRMPINKINPEKYEIVETTVGRILFNQYVPDQIPYYNQVCNKKT